MRPCLFSLSAAFAGWLLAGTPLAAQDLSADPPAAGDIALMGTIPIYWGEVDSLEGLLTAAGSGHWARPLLEAHYRLRPLDYLSDDTLEGHTRLLMAQPRGLAPEENVALDQWVRSGGQLLLFADPLMTGHSQFAIGDRRRPQDVALLSPILRHWGLELLYDPAQEEGRRIGNDVPHAIPVEQAGQLAVGNQSSDCTISQERITAECRLGAGIVLVVADAALFDGDVPSDGATEALEALLGMVYGNPVP